MLSIRNRFGLVIKSFVKKILLLLLLLCYNSIDLLELIMTRGKKLSTSQIEEIVGMVKDGMRPMAIVEATELPRRTVYDLLARIRAGTHYEVKKKTGRKRITSSTTDRAIAREVKKSRKTSSSAIKESLKLQGVSERTIQRRVFESIGRRKNRIAQSSPISQT